MNLFRYFAISVLCLVLPVALVYAAKGPCNFYAGRTVDNIACTGFSCAGEKTVYYDTWSCGNTNEADCPTSPKVMWTSYPAQQGICILSSQCSASSTGTNGAPQAMCN
jgi:hypothetical protein